MKASKKEQNGIFTFNFLDFRNVGKTLGVAFTIEW